MNAIVKLEIIGDNYHAYVAALNSGKIKHIKIKEMCQALKYGQPKYYPSIFRIDDGHRIRIGRMMKDYSQAKKLGERNVFDWYTLQPGTYEINECVALGVMAMKIIVVNDDGSVAESNNG